MKLLLRECASLTSCHTRLLLLITGFFAASGTNCPLLIAFKIAISSEQTFSILILAYVFFIVQITT